MKNIGLFLKFFLLSMVFIGVFAALIGMGLYLHYSRSLPKIIQVTDYNPKVITQVLDKKGAMVGEFFREKREITLYNKIPVMLIQAFIASEDSRFFEHKGLDFTGILRAMVVNFKSGHFSQGGSTITQQVARSLLLTSEKKISRKVKEAILASKIESHLNKEDILFLYLNQIYLGHNAYGVQSAAHLYFNKDVNQLTLAECALLAGLPQAPSKWSPFTNPDKAKERQMYVLTRMVEDGYITKDAAEKAANERIKLYKNVDINLENAPYFTEFVRRYLFARYGADKVLDDGLKVYTTLDSGLQKIAQESIKQGLKNLDKKQGFRGPVAHLSNDESIKKEMISIHKEILESVREYIYFPEQWQDFKIRTKMFSVETKKDNSKGDINSQQTPLDKGKDYKAIVLGLNEKGQEIKITVGNTPGVIKKEGFTWVYPGGKLNPSTLKRGDVIYVSLIRPGFFAIEQKPLVEASLLSFNVADGSINALVGGYDYSESEFNRAYQSKRQAGSTFKPMVYSAALDKGYTPASVIVDSPIVYGGDENADETWKPSNYSEQFYGDTTLRDAIIFSRNIPTTKILQDIKPSYVIEYAKRMGIKSKMPNDLSLGLGSTAVSLWEMTKAFAVFASGGKRVIPFFIYKVEDRKGNVLEQYDPNKPFDAVLSYSIDDKKEIEEKREPSEEKLPEVQTAEQKAAAENKPAAADAKPVVDLPPPGYVIPPQTAYIMNYLLKDAATRGTGAKVGAALNIPVAGKTGTSNSYTDAWFIGYTPSVVTGVWVGFDDNSKSLGSGATGAEVAIPIWIPYMKEAVKNYKTLDFDQPTGIKYLKIDGKTGKVASRFSQKVLNMPFKEGTEPTQVEGETKVEDADETQYFRENN
ncbi:MAG: PBP1A family penicillin-binding protein [bacterium]